jgi:hypothetical protein
LHRFFFIAENMREGYLLNRKGGHMNSITIAPRLWFEETLLGATLNFQSSDKAEEGVLFRVGLSFQSLMDCDKNLSSSACLWTIKDGSLSVYGDFEELTLTFCSVNGTLIQMGLSLFGEELNAFRYAVNSLAARKKIALN